VLAALIAAVVLLALFVMTERQVPNPMLPIALFRSRMFTGTNVLTFLLYAPLGGTLFFLPLNLIQVQRYSATAAGAALLPFILIISLLSRWSGGLVTRYGPKLPLLIGSLIAASGYLLFMLPTVGGSYWITFFPPVVVLGLGMAICVAPLTTAVMSSATENHAGIASGVNNAIARTASLIAIAVLGIVMLQVFNHALGERVAQSNLPISVTQSLQMQRTKLAAIAVPEDQHPVTQQQIRHAVDESFVSGFRCIMAIGAALATASAVTALTLVRTHGAPDKIRRATQSR
jgi:MFS family permease